MGLNTQLKTSTVNDRHPMEDNTRFKNCVISSNVAFFMLDFEYAKKFFFFNRQEP